MGARDKCILRSTEGACLDVLSAAVNKRALSQTNERQVPKPCAMHAPPSLALTHVNGHTPHTLSYTQRFKWKRLTGEKWKGLIKYSPKCLKPWVRMVFVQMTVALSPLTGRYQLTSWSHLGTFYNLGNLHKSSLCASLHVLFHPFLPQVFINGWSWNTRQDEISS